MFLQEGWFQLALPLSAKNEIVGLMGPTIPVDDGHGRWERVRSQKKLSDSQVNRDRNKILKILV
jgi:hypothetical protein